MIFYAISDRKQEKNGDLHRQMEKYIKLKVDWIQVREKDLSDREILKAAKETAGKCGENNIKIFVNSRADIAALAGACGVHLPADSLPIRSIKRRFPALKTVKSCHSSEDVLSAEDQGADFAVLSPIFPTPSKAGVLEPLGLKTLEQTCLMVKIPVIALGGISRGTIRDVAEAGAEGIAGIRLFNEWTDGEEENFSPILRTGL